MTSTRTGRRRVGATLVGALGGAIGGLGATVVMTQSGQLDVDLGAPMLAVSIVAGAVIALIEPPAWADRFLAVLIVAGAIAVGVVGVGEPAGAQAACRVVAVVDGVEHDLARTTRDDPFIVDVGAAPEIAFEARAPTVRRGRIEVVVAAIYPPLLPTDDQVVFRGEIVSGSASESVRVERSGLTGFRLVSPEFRSPIVPLGVAELGIEVIDFDDDGTAVEGCPEVAWARAVATPADNPLGQAALGSTVLGAAMVVAAGPLRRLRRRRRTGGEPPAGAEPADGDERPPAPSEVSYDAIEGVGPHADHTDVRILDGDGHQIDPSAPLVAGRDYRISVTFGLGLTDERDTDASDARGELTAVSSSRSLGLRPQVSLGFAGLPISIPIEPRRSGRHRVSIDAVHRGHHVQTERVEFTVVDDPSAAADAQSTTTLISTVRPTRSVLDELPARQVLVILEHDERDGSIDPRVLGEDGHTIVAYDTRLQAQALDDAAAQVRTALGEMLEVARHGLDLDRDTLSAAGTPVVAAGRQLAMALFPDTAVALEQVDALSQRVADGAIVQVVTHRAGLGHATVPWALVYDHRFTRRGAGNAVCGSFATHPVDACPSVDDPQVWCPTGFWGYRSIVEELWTSTEQIDVQPVVPAVSAAAAPAEVVAYLDPGFGASSVQGRTIARLGGRRLDDFDDVLTWLDADDDDLELVYLFAHHRDGPNGGLVIGDDVLGAVTLNAQRNHRRSCWSRRPLVIVNGCATGAVSSSAPVSLLDELRAYGAGGAVTSECTVWDGVAGECGLRVLDGLAAGRPIGEIVTTMRRELLREHGNPVGFAYRLLAHADVTLPEPEMAEPEMV